MKITEFNAQDVYGYLRFDIRFHQDLSFLIGVNGSGKTTVLRLIQALLTPSFIDLLTIPFVKCSVTYEEKGAPVTISAIKDNESLRIRVSVIDGELAAPIVPEEQREVLTSREGGDFLEEYQLKFRDHPIFKFILQISAPVFLGLERTHRDHSESTDEFYFDHDRHYSVSARRSMRAKRMIRGSLGAGLMETQLLIQEAYRRLRRMEQIQAEKFRESVVLSAFQYKEFSLPSKNPAELLPDWREKRDMQTRKSELENALRNIGLSSDRVKGVLEEFFSRIDKLFKEMTADGSGGFPIDWVVNKAQIDRVGDLIAVIDENKSKIDELFSPVSTFLTTVNSFYSDTQKSISMDTVGQLSVERPDKQTAPIEALSSGERQLLIIFAHLLFNQYGNRSNVFIIDEPELSLHLRWQEVFVKKAIEVSPKIQLVLATHSPEIVGDFKNKSITV